VISGDGTTAWVTTNTNRLLRFNLSQGTSEELLSEFPTSLGTGRGVPGSAVGLRGAPSIAGEHVLSGALEFPILPPDSSVGTLVQVPWELAAQLPAKGYMPVPLVLRKDGYPFELPLDFSATNQVTPGFAWPLLVNDDQFVKAASSDFSHLIDADHPAIPGQTIVVWLTGLGPLDQPVATGAPGPNNPPAHPLAHLECGLASKGGSMWEGLNLPFIGYAPGLVGVYQVNVVIPSDWPAGTAVLDCYTGTASSALYLPVGSPPQ
jgi:uncharacterized protein (TIGR03437 family)